MVDSSEELKSSRSVYGKDFLDFEMLDAKIVLALNKMIQNFQFKKKVNLEEQKAQKEDQFLRGRQIAVMIYDYFRVTGAHDTLFDYTDFFSVTLYNDNVQEFDTIWDEVLLSVSKIPSDYVVASLCKLMIRESDQLTQSRIGNCARWRFFKKSMPNNQKLKMMAKRNVDQKLRSRNFDAGHGKLGTGASGQ